MRPVDCSLGEERLELAPGGSAPAVLRVVEAAEAIAAGDCRMAQAELGALLPHVAVRSTAVERVCHLFVQSLRARLTGDLSGSGNLYHDSPHPGDMLAAFQLLLAATPFISYGYHSANLAILQALGDRPRLHVVDIGIGSGTQWLQILSALAARRAPLPQFHLTGIDLPAAGGDPLQRLRDLRYRLERQAGALGVPFGCEVIAATAEELDFGMIRRRADEVLAVNAAFALHHIAAEDGVIQPERSRDAVLQRLRTLEPHILTLVEPDAEHNSLPFAAHVREALSHYLTVFDALQTLLPNHPAERALIETTFFGREILNIVAGEGAERVERHERHTGWQRRLHKVGFAPIDLTHHGAAIAAQLHLAPSFALCFDHGGMALAWKGVPLVATSAWRPAD